MGLSLTEGLNFYNMINQYLKIDRERYLYLVSDMPQIILHIY